MTVEPGWYVDPWNEKALRFWDGGSWTPQSVRRPPEPRPVFASEALFPALVGLVASVVGARVVSTVLFNALDVPDEIYLAVFYGTVFGGIWLTCTGVSRRFGTG